MKVSIFWDTLPFSSYVNRCFAENYWLHLQGGKSGEQQASLQQLVRYMWTTRCYIPGGGNFHNYC